MILPIDKQQLIQTCLTANSIYCEKERISICETKVQYSSDILIKVMNKIFVLRYYGNKPLFCSYKMLIYYLGK